MKPRYQHDCSDCQWLGSIDYPAPHHTKGRGDYTVMKHADLYFCLQCAMSIGGTVIARFSSRGSNYASMPVFLVQNSIMQKIEFYDWSTEMPALKTAVMFAKVKKLIPTEK